MPPPQGWAELPGDLLACVAGRHRQALTCYLAARGVCKAWRSALPPASPFLLVADGGTVSAVSVPLRTAFRLDKIRKHYQYIGAGHGWLAVAYHKEPEVRVINDTRVGARRVTRGLPIARPAVATETTEQRMDREVKEQYYRSFEGAQVRVEPDELREIEKRRGKPKSYMALFNPVTGRKIELPEHARLDPWTVSRVAFAPNPRADDFTAVVAFGRNSLAYVSTRVDGGGAWSFGAIAGEDMIDDVAYRAGAGGEDDDDRVYCLTRPGDVHVLHVPRGGPTKNYPVLVPLAGCRFSPGDVFPSPYDRLSECLSTKKLAFCDGDVYQVWRNSSSTMFVLNKEGGGYLRVAMDEVVVLRYEASSGKPCWKAVGDLGGHAVLVGPANSAGAVSVRAEAAVPGIKGDCVYWLGSFGDTTAMVFDMKTRRSTTCLSPYTDGGGVPICWYALGDLANSSDADGEVLEREPKRRRLL